jgi:apolipoprotein N-acyltransferase
LNFFLNINPLIQVIISGFTTGLAFHPLGLGFLAWGSFVPLIHVFNISHFRKNIIYGYIFGLSFNLTAFYWIGVNSGADFLTVLGSLFAAVFYLAFFWAGAGLLFSLISKGDQHISGNIFFPFIIVLIEYVRSFGALGFPWSNLALTQSNYIYFIQFIEVTGTYGVSFFIIGFNVILYNVVQKKISLLKGLSFILLIIIGLSIAGAGRILSLPKSNQKISVAVVQPNVNPNTKWLNKKKIIAFMDSLHQESIKFKPDLIVFPETALPSYLVRDNRTRGALQSKVNSSDIPLLTGTIHTSFENNFRYYYNSSMFIIPQKKYELYSKIHLVPFAEYDLIPSIFHPLTKLNINIDRGNFKSGNNYKVFKHENLLFSNLICYESSIPKISRTFVSKGAEFLIIQANDGWLGSSFGPYQHFELARLRAIENRIPIVRCANTGISGIINIDGSIKTKVQLNEEKIIFESLSSNKNGSFYTKYGDIFAIIISIIILIVILYKCRKYF